MKERFVKLSLWFFICLVALYVFCMAFPEETQRLSLIIRAQAIESFDQSVAGRVKGVEQKSENEAGKVAHGTGRAGTAGITGEESPTIVMGEGQSIADASIDISVEAGNSDPSDATLENNEGAGDSAAQSGQPAVVNSLTTGTQCILPQSQILSRIMNLCTSGAISQEQLLDNSYLLSRFFVVPSDTSLPPQVLNGQVLLSKNLQVEKGGDAPVILIYHTHSQEAYADSRPGVEADTVLGMGDLLTQELEARGYVVLHHRGIYDITDGVLDRNPAYTKALPQLAALLSEYPSIQVMIDLHRDGVNEDVHLITEQNGLSMARFMLVNGLCRTTEGERTDITNPYREDGLALALQTALMAESFYPGMFRTIYTRPGQYNQHLMSRSLLLEVGAQTNTVEEARNAIPVIADILDRVLGEE